MARSDWAGNSEEKSTTVSKKMAAPVRLTIDGREHFGHPQIEDDPGRVALTLKMLYDRYGPSRAGLLELKVNVSRPPTAEEIRPAVADRWIARIRLIHLGPGSEVGRGCT